MERKREVDIIKGLCIITIVFAHTKITFLWFDYIHLYGFYFAAGYTFKNKPFVKFLKSKIHGLYIPFVLNCILGLLVLFILSKVSNGYYPFSLELLSIKIFLMNIPHLILAPAWFVFPIFVIYFIFYFLKKIVKNTYVILILSFILYVGAYIFHDKIIIYQWNNCAWLINVFLGLFVFSLGHTMQNNKKIESFLFGGKFSMVFFCVSTLVLFSITTYTTYEIDLRAGVIDKFVPNLFVILFGIIFLSSLSKLIDKAKIIGKVVSILGKHTRAIMFFHVISYSIVTLSGHYLLKYSYPEPPYYAYTTGLFKVLNGIAGLCIPFMCSVLFKYTQKKLLKRCF